MFRHSLGALVASLALTAGGTAQQPGQQNPTAQNPGSKSQPGQSAPGSFGQRPWFEDMGVRQHLKLTQEQYDRLNKAYSDLYTRHSKDFSSLDKLEGEQRSQREAQLSQQFHQGFSKSTHDVLNPQQQQRWGQLHLQYQGLDAFQDPMVQQKLNLTQEQLQQIRQASQEYQRQMAEIRRSDAKDAGRRLSELRQRSNERIQTILNEQQQQSWQGMIGEPYNFQFSANANVQSGNQNQNRNQNQDRKQNPSQNPDR